MKEILSRIYVAILLIGWMLTFERQTRAEQRSATSAPYRTLALVGAKIYPSPTEAPILNGVVLIKNGRIAKVGKTRIVKVPGNALVIDCKGKTLVAGLWNAHVHFIESKWNDARIKPSGLLTKQFQEMLTSHGFTSVVDTGSPLQNTIELKNRIAQGDVDGPRIFTSGTIIFPPSGLPYYADTLSPPVRQAFTKGIAETPADAIRIVDQQLDQGADIVKLYAVTWLKHDGNIEPAPMPLTIVKAATDEAHRRGKLVFAHPSTMQGVKLVLDGHVDVLAHTSEEPEKWDAALSCRLKAANVTLIPTLTLFSGDDNFDGILNEVKSYADFHGRIMFGTDVGYLTKYSDLDEEYRYLSRSGLTFIQILASLTTTPASLFGFGKRAGRIREGMDADLVILTRDPALNPVSFSEAWMTIRQGRVIFSQR